MPVQEKSRPGNIFVILLVVAMAVLVLGYGAVAAVGHAARSAETTSPEKTSGHRYTVGICEGLVNNHDADSGHAAAEVCGSRS